MKAIAIEQTGGPDVLIYRDMPDPVPKPDEIVVETAAIGVNFIDVYFRMGRYPSPSLPFIPGMEAAGTVTATGSAAGKFRVGDRVAYAQTLGSYADYHAVPQNKAVRIPDGAGFEAAAAAMLQGMTAHYLVNTLFALEANQTALVHAGAGGVGLLLTQMAKAKGARVITTVSNDTKAELSREAGADDVVVGYDGFAQRVREATGGTGADVVYDGVGAATFEGSLDSLRKRGMLALYGASSGPVPPFDLQRLNGKGSLFVTRPTLADYVLTESELTTRATEVFEAIAAGDLELRVAHTYPLAEAARAHRELEARGTTGKLLLVPG